MKQATLPLSDHCNGEIFINPPLPEDWEEAPRPPSWPDAPHTGRSGVKAGRRRRGIRPLVFLRWILSTIFEKPSHNLEPDVAGNPHCVPGQGEVAVTFIGHSTFLLRYSLPGGGTLSVLTDPIFSDRCSPASFIGPKRFRPPAYQLADLPPIDVVLVSHCHYDHLDLPSLRALARRDNPVVVTTARTGDLIRKAGLLRVSELDWWRSVRIGDLEIVCTPARHFTQRGLTDAGKRLWGGFFLRFPKSPERPSVFFAGDTAHGPHWREIRTRLGAPDVALLPIGAYAPRPMLRKVHTDPVEAVEAFRQLQARQGIAMHFGTFPLSQEPLGEPERCLRETADWAGLAPGVFEAPGFGETRLISR
ncbi:MBL fold metallo-hydrolase [Acetobacter sp.]|jgi:L-ascorbate metabolism protein UlaG (beta-lactamase superfamily)|uniref:MBL fold metallo-hydrolase n=1 Tax=Acetobacter sp. TaxID=440 RepID=UPI0025BB3911|nr:MBL fold metallo-hydrolase [Acetobacter sp.]MCH4091706.1 MBL fold metallo-hydrolase [Acetobacter sp.]MCI1300437.1 MBL fold metallo-hydrolase [Acetobacter sp.]MCI1316744.1 MBL fold metallo-hydrolase [Acetobacter sp.]